MLRNRVPHAPNLTRGTPV